MRRPVLYGLQQRREIGHRSVVQVRRAQPDAVERHRDVAVGRSKVRELPVVAFAVGVVGGGRRRRPHLEAMAVGADFLRRDDGAGSRPAGRVARRALGRVHLGAGGRERLVDRERVSRRRHVLDVVLKAIPLAGESIDHILLWHVLEHIQNDHSVIKEMHRVLRHQPRRMLGQHRLDWTARAHHRGARRASRVGPAPAAGHAGCIDRSSKE